MCDLIDEVLLSTEAARAWIGRRRGGLVPARSTLARWMGRGVKGVVLESVRVGGLVHTSEDAVRRFFDRLSNPGRPPSPSRRRRAEIEVASRRARELFG